MAATSYTASQIAHQPEGGVVATNVQAAVSEVAADVVAEITAAITGLASASDLSTETTARIAADTALTTAVGLKASTAALTAETNARTSADTALDGRLTTVESRRLDQVPAPTSAVALNGQKITSLADPTNPQDAATRAFTLAQITALINGAPGTLDTLKEIADQLATDESAVGAIVASVTAESAARVAADAAVQGRALAFTIALGA